MKGMKKSGDTSSLFFIQHINSIKDQSLHLARHFFFVQRFFTAVLQQ